MPQIGSPAGLTAFNLYIPKGNVDVTETVAGVDLKDYIDDIFIILNQKRPNGSAGTCAISFLDSTDNSTFVAISSPTFANITTATETTATVSINTKAINRYLQVKEVITSANNTSTYISSIVGVGLKQVV